ncbi:MAG: membrane protein, Rhomboid family [Candidatus Carbobacillus altaicus]|uniref:Membrane protein, Rhomboid family n=1 Tax=Candidatus Carbonibacillus altaicus TaxID=2163959 RepID=A0A2R6Y1J4_9BACL|nr:MAG: membrane protein, Rhomboid family [Candidatus Carbobacillus altaicus]
MPPYTIEDREKKVTFFWTLADHILHEDAFHLLDVPAFGYSASHQGDIQETIHFVKPAENELFYIRLLMLVPTWGVVIERTIQESVLVAQALRRKWPGKKIRMLVLYAWLDTPHADLTTRLTENGHVAFGRDTLDAYGLILENGSRALSNIPWERFGIAGERLLRRLTESSVGVTKQKFLETLLTAPQTSASSGQMTKRTMFKTDGLIGWLLVTLLLLTYGSTLAAGFSPGVHDFFASFVYAPETGSIQWWQLFTMSVYQHSFPLLVFNSLTLILISGTVGRLFGAWRFLSIFFFGGALGLAFGAALHQPILAGASPGLFAIFGALLVMGVEHRLFRYTGYVRDLMIFFVLYGLTFGFASGASLVSLYGGMLGGMLLGIAISPAVPPPHPLRRLAGLTLYAFLLIYVWHQSTV